MCSAEDYDEGFDGNVSVWEKSNSPEDVAAYYRQLGYWERSLPKTDYAYSKSSPFYNKEIAPGIPLVPNMCRSSIYDDDDDIVVALSENSTINESYAAFCTLSSVKKQRTYFSLYGTDIDPEAENLVGDKSYFQIRPVIRKMYDLSVVSTSVFNRFVRAFAGLIKDNVVSVPLALASNLFQSITFLQYRQDPASIRSYHQQSKHSADTSNVTAMNINNNRSEIRNTKLSLHVKKESLLTNTGTTNGRAMNALQCNKNKEKRCRKNIFILGAYALPLLFVILLLYLTDTRPIIMDILSAGISVPLSLLSGLLYSLFNTAVLIYNSIPLAFATIDSSWFMWNTNSGSIPDQLRKFKLQQVLFRSPYTSVPMTSGELNINYTKLAEGILMSKGFRTVSEWGRTQFDHEAQLNNKEIKLLKNEIQSIVEKTVKQEMEKLAPEYWQWERKEIEKVIHSYLESNRLPCPHCPEIRAEILRKVEKSSSMYSKGEDCGKGAAVSGCQDVEYLEQFVNKIVQKAIRIYDADKTGKVDYALETSGGEILSTRCTENIVSGGTVTFLGFPIWHRQRNPRIVIQPGAYPGECWAFSGSLGFLVIKLSQRIYITGFTLEHIPVSLAPNKTIDSAPKDFSVWGLHQETDSESVFLGRFAYIVDEEKSLQYFDAVKSEQSFEIVELKIESNHGKPEYTCVYRFRVHGIPTVY